MGYDRVVNITSFIFYYYYIMTSLFIIIIHLTRLIMPGRVQELL